MDDGVRSPAKEREDDDIDGMVSGDVQGDDEFECECDSDSERVMGCDDWCG